MSLLGKLFSCKISSKGNQVRVAQVQGMAKLSRDRPEDRLPISAVKLMVGFHHYTGVCSLRPTCNWCNHVNLSLHKHS